MSNVPFIKLFKSMYGFYFYDVNTNRIVNIKEKSYVKLEKIIKICKENADCDEISRIISDDDEIQVLHNKGLLKNRNARNPQNPVLFKKQTAHSDFASYSAV